MIAFDFNKECYSCGLCVDVCPKSAITLDKSLHPVVDGTMCINCGLCDRMCIRQGDQSFHKELNPSAEAFVARSLDDTIRLKSSSGGIFWHIAAYVIRTGGVVCGVKYDNDFMPIHAIAQDMDGVSEFIGSKYAQSDMGAIYSDIQHALDAGKTVCFTGVPCQVAAIEKRFNSIRERLILIAVVCHGSIERGLWQKYLDEEKAGKQITYVTMRDKSQGWLNYGLRIVFDDGTEHVTFRKQDGYFLKCFTDGLLERDRCLNCQYKGDAIKADILLGDGWGVYKKYPEFNDTLGASSVICLTDKGKNLFESIREKLLVKQVTVEEIIDSNQRIISPAGENRFRGRFNKEISRNNSNIHDICKKYAAQTFFNRVREKLLW